MRVRALPLAEASPLELAVFWLSRLDSSCGQPGARASAYIRLPGLSHRALREDMDAQPERVPARWGFGIGAAYQGVVTALTAPFLRANLILQTQDANPRVISGEIPRYRSAVDFLRRTAAENGLASLWRGHNPLSPTTWLNRASLFGLKEGTRNLLVGRTGQSETFTGELSVNAASGVVAAAGSQAIAFPLDHASTRVAADIGGKQFSGVIDCLRQKASGPAGVSGLYEGFPLSSMPSMVRVSVNLCVNDTLNRYNPYQQESVLSRYACAHVAAICARIVGHPIDIVVRHVLLDFRNEYKGFADCFSKLSKEGKLFRGLASPALFLRPAIPLFVYGEAKGLLLLFLHAFDLINILLSVFDSFQTAGIPLLAIFRFPVF